jgi:hypothetical protein
MPWLSRVPWLPRLRLARLPMRRLWWLLRTLGTVPLVLSSTT